MMLKIFYVAIFDSSISPNVFLTNSIIWHGTNGNLIQNMVIAEIVKRNRHNNLMQDFWYWLNSDGKIVDLIVQDDYLYRVLKSNPMDGIVMSNLSFRIKYFFLM